MKNIPFFRSNITDEDKSLVNRTLEDFSYEPAREFEEDIVRFFNKKYAIVTDNGTSAQHLALCAMDIKRADKIICSVNSFPSVAEVIRHFDAEPIPVDIDEHDFNIDPNKLEDALKKHNHKKLKAAFITHIAGVSAKMDEIYDIAKRYDIKIIDDASRAMGATYKNQKIGSHDDSFISCFQINPQFENTIATAGFFTTNDDETAHRAKLIRSHAIVSSKSKDGSLDYIYDVVDIGQRYNLSGICAAFAKSQFGKTADFIKRRKEIAKIYDKELADCPHVTIPAKNKDHIYTQYIVKIDRNRDNFAKKLKELGVSVSLHYIPLHLLTYYKQKYDFKVNDFPVALKTYQQVLSLPIYADLSDEEVYYVCEKVKQVAKNHV
ncbi:MAG: DegT/DnrJ/EryC1/StrS aminotransferase family protein [Campylobacteraceae bacterium]|nr:DegT/DnrJ/EryC1/StrS aminotransferase family protein [Campylobacteraceae bacterium]